MGEAAAVQAKPIVFSADGSSIAGMTVSIPTIASVGGRIRGTVSAANFPQGYWQVSGLTPGATYNVSAMSYPHAGIFARLNISDNSAAGSDLYGSGNITGAIAASFVAPADGAIYVSTIITSFTNGDYAEIGSIQIQLA